MSDNATPPRSADSDFQEKFNGSATDAQPKLPNSSIYPVLDEFYCLWEIDQVSRNHAFLKGIDAGYFDYVARSNIDPLNGDDSKMRAAVNLRLAYFNGIETLFLLLGAMLQAPDCAYAWVAQCTSGQLRMLLRRIEKIDSTLPLKVLLSPLSWDRIGKGVMAYSSSDGSKSARNGELFGQLWSRFASDYLEDSNIKEYNSLKHGFRVRHGGFGLAFGIEKEYAISPPPEEMQAIGGSEFGSTFYVIENIGGSARGNRSRRSRQVSVNWSVERLVLSLQLVSMSIGNVVSALEILNGTKPSEVRFSRPSKDRDFVRPWEDPLGVTNMNIDFVIPDGDALTH